MAGSHKDSDTEYVLKKGGDDVPVDACKSWTDPCEYCGKRFGKWIPVDEEVYGKIPEKPGFFMIALKNKNIEEVVSLLFDPTNIQKIAVDSMDDIKKQISNKKNKASKSEMLVRWMAVKKVDDKENSVLCAHWCNNGIMPKFMLSWPGMKLLEESEYLTFSKYMQKWCYAKKDPVWRKSKQTSSKITEEVKKCSFESCEICDSYFKTWKSLSEVEEKDLAPEDYGLIMFSIVFGKCREVVLISSDKSKVITNIKDAVKKYSVNEHNYLQHEKFAKKNARSEVRWMITKDVDGDNACFLYAHWFNADKCPMFNYDQMPGERSLDKNKHFVVRNQDKKWMYEVEAFKQAKFSKAKNKRRVLEELQDEEYMDTA